MTIKFGCHGSTWELDYDKESDNLDHIIDVVAQSGFKGIDIQVALLGRYKSAPQQLREKLESKGIELAALTLPFDWRSDKESSEEKQLADFYIEFLSKFPKALLNAPARVGPNRDNLLKRQRDILSCVTDLGKRAQEKGVLVCFHPASPPTSYFRIESDYEVMFEELDTRYVGYTPDAGHIAAGGMDVVEIFKKALPIIKHVHFKDCSSQFEWRKMGTGDINFPAIVSLLSNYGYKGWIMVEEETEETKVDPDQVIMDIGQYVQKTLQPNVKKVGTL